MTKPLSFTRAQIRRAIEGARSAGLSGDITINPDGSIRIHSEAAPPLAPVALSAQDNPFKGRA